MFVDLVLIKPAFNLLELSHHVTKSMADWFSWQSISRAPEGTPYQPTTVRAFLKMLAKQRGLQITVICRIKVVCREPQEILIDAFKGEERKPKKSAKK